MDTELNMDDRRCAEQLREWVEQHYALLYRYAFRLSGSAADAEDLTQQAFLTAQRKMTQLREPSHAKAWLCTIIRNSYLKSFRNKNAGNEVSLSNVAEPAGDIPDNPVLDTEELQTVLNELPEDFRTPLILFYFEDFSYKQIAEQMDVPLGTAMSRLARAKEYLRRRLTTEQPVATKP